jgi:hypothetical protein
VASGLAAFRPGREGAVVLGGWETAWMLRDGTDWAHKREQGGARVLGAGTAMAAGTTARPRREAAVPIL